MFSTLTQEEIQREIQNSAAMALVGMYLQKEFEGKERYLNTHFSSHPIFGEETYSEKLRNLIITEKGKTNPIGKLGSLEEALASLEMSERQIVLENGKNDIGELKRDLEEKIGSTKENPYVSDTELMIYTIQTMEESKKRTQKFKTFLERFYASISIAIRAVAEEERKEDIEVVSSQNLRDEVYRRLFPTREEAEKYLITDRYLSRLVFESTIKNFEVQSLLAEAEGSLSEENENYLVVTLSTLYGIKEIEPAFEIANKGYEKVKLDRIYGARE